MILAPRSTYLMESKLIPSLLAEDNSNLDGNLIPNTFLLLGEETVTRVLSNNMDKYFGRQSLCKSR